MAGGVGCDGEVEVECTDSVREALRQAAAAAEKGPSAASDEEELAFESYLEAETVPWRVVLGAMRVNRRSAPQAEGAADPLLLAGAVDADGGSDDDGGEKKRKRRKNPELERIEREMQERKYAEWVKDIEPSAAARDRVYMSAYRDQIGLGLNLVAVMGTLFAFGYFIGLRFTAGDADADADAAGKVNVWPLCLGLVGAFVGLIVETLLFMIRSRDADRGRSGGGGGRKGTGRIPKPKPEPEKPAARKKKDKKV
mmetsp:Transcript_4181/g.10717  ORF Transcript_4181/g.10717 Transcript_4181/m.10717 type:complete len:254 (-) Transcript_4181:58-819(-)